MTDIEQIQAQYEKMYDAMIHKDEAALAAVLDDSFVLVHMTGMRQSKTAFLRAVMDGTLNYFSARHENMSVTVHGDTAVITGQSYVTAAVFGGGRNNWRLQQRITLIQKGGTWLMTQAVASTY